MRFHIEDKVQIDSAVNEVLLRYRGDKRTNFRKYVADVANERKIDLGVLLGACGKRRADQTIRKPVRGRPRIWWTD